MNDKKTDAARTSIGLRPAVAPPVVQPKAAHLMAALGQRSQPAVQAKGAPHVLAALSRSAAPIVQAKAAGSVPQARPLTRPAAIQRMDVDEKAVARHNLLVLASYGKDSLKEVREAFFQAGYDSSNWEEAAIGALHASKKWGKTKIAHGFGAEKKSKKRAGTDENVQLCKQYLLDWVG